MVRGGKETRLRRRLAPTEELARIKSDLDTLHQIATAYDKGSLQLIQQAPVVIHKILCNGRASTSQRRKRQFSTPTRSISSANLFQENKLIFLRNNNEGVKYLPAFQAHEYQCAQLQFVPWWNRETVFQGPAKSHQSNRRDKMTRREIITVFRNTQGAHSDNHTDVALEKMDQWGMGFDIGLIGADGTSSTSDGSHPVLISALAASIRQITQEVILAFGAPPVGQL